MASTSKVVRVPKASAGQINTIIEFMMEHKDLAAGRLCGMRGRELLVSRWQELASLLNTLGPHKSMTQWQKVWTDLKYKVRGRAAALRAGHFETGNRPKNEPVLNENEKKVLMIIGTATAEGYCVADSLPESQEDLERAMEGTAIPSVEDSPPRLFLEEILETPTGLMLVVEQDPDDPAYGPPSHPHHEQLAKKRKGSEKGTPQRVPKIKKLRDTIQESREQFAELQAGQTEVLRMIAENIIQQTSATKEFAAVKDSIKELAAGMFAVSESLNRIADAINKK